MGKTLKIEHEAEKLLKEIRISLKKLVGFMTTIPKNKMDKIFWIMQVVAWLLFTITIFGRARW